jgi:hypothetical protein
MTDHPVRLAAQREVSLVEILDRALGAGVVITGEITISLADIDLVYLDLRLLVGAVGTIWDGQGDATEGAIPSVGRGNADSP